MSDYGDYRNNSGYDSGYFELVAMVFVFIVVVYVTARMFL